jgi:hypothetical protein
LRDGKCFPRFQPPCDLVERLIGFEHFEPCIETNFTKSVWLIEQVDFTDTGVVGQALRNGHCSFRLNAVALEVEHCNRGVVREALRNQSHVGIGDTTIHEIDGGDVRVRLERLCEQTAVLMCLHAEEGIAVKVEEGERGVIGGHLLDDHLGGLRSEARHRRALWLRRSL